MTESTNTLGRYQILREIARSNDVVYEAIDPVVGRHVALKELVFPPNLTGSQRQERVQRFYREAKAAGALAHPNIVTIYEVGEEKGRHFIAMEFLEGQTLRDILRVNGALPIQEAVRIAVELCHALEYAHSRSVVHRDVKPDNVYVLPDGRVKLADFGIARLTNEPTLTANGQVFGTPSYMSPEQVAGKPVDGRSDLFSLGVMLHEMLAGGKPFTGDSIVTITYNIMNSYPGLPLGIPVSLGAALRKAMAKAPEDRFASAREMLETLVNPQSMVAQPAPAPIIPPTGSPATAVPGAIALPPRLPKQPFLTPRQAGRVWTAALALIVLVLVVLGGLLVSASIDSYQARQFYNRGMAQVSRSAELSSAKRYTESLQASRQALREFEQALRISPGGEMGRQARRSASNVAIGIAGLCLAIAPPRPDEALDSLKRALDFDPRNADAFLEIGVFYGRRVYVHLNQLDPNGRIDTQDIEMALYNLKQAMAFGVGTRTSARAEEIYGALCYDLGGVLWNAGAHDGARSYWTRAVTEAGGSPAARKAEDLINQHAAE